MGWFQFHIFIVPKQLLRTSIEAEVSFVKQQTKYSYLIGRSNYPWTQI